MRFWKFTFTIALVGLFAGCSPKSESNENVSVSITGLKTVKTDETRYESIKSISVSYETTAEVVALTDGGAPNPSGQLHLEIKETTGFLDVGDEAIFETVSIVNGKGHLKKTWYKSSIPDNRPLPGPPRVEIRRALFDAFRRATVSASIDPSAIKKDQAAIEFNTTPTRVVTSASGDSFEAATEFRIKSFGTLQGKGYLFTVKRTTTESPDPQKIGDEVTMSIVVLNGEAARTVRDYLMLSSSSNGKSPMAPKYVYEPMGYSEYASSAVSIK
jgi:hypothetical protein